MAELSGWQQIHHKQEDERFVSHRHITALNLPQHHLWALLGDRVFARDFTTSTSPWMEQGALHAAMTFSIGSRD